MIFQLLLLIVAMIDTGGCWIWGISTPRRKSWLVASRMSWNAWLSSPGRRGRRTCVENGKIPGFWIIFEENAAVGVQAAHFQSRWVWNPWVFVHSSLWILAEMSRNELMRRRMRCFNQFWCIPLNYNNDIQWQDQSSASLSENEAFTTPRPHPFWNWSKPSRCSWMGYVGIQRKSADVF